MKSKKLFILAFIVPSALTNPCVWAATKQTTTYNLERAWLDAAHLYVLYNEETTRVRYSLGDIHGSILSDKKRLRIAGFLRAEIKDGGAIALDKGESADTLVYKDADFAINAIPGAPAGRWQLLDICVCQREPDLEYRSNRPAVL